jgi:hypothetical protein
MYFGAPSWSWASVEGRVNYRMPMNHPSEFIYAAKDKAAIVEVSIDGGMTKVTGGIL